MKRIAVAVIVGAVILMFVSRNALLLRGARNGQSALISVALAIGADKNGYAEDGTTPLIAAAAAGQSGAVDRLIAARADVNGKNRDTGATPLMVAAERGDLPIVESLLAAGASVSARDNKNRSAYTYAFHNSRFEVARKVHYVAEAKVDLPAATSAVALTQRSPRTGGGAPPTTGSQQEFNTKNQEAQKKFFDEQERKLRERNEANERAGRERLNEGKAFEERDRKIREAREARERKAKPPQR